MGHDIADAAVRATATARAEHARIDRRLKGSVAFGRASCDPLYQTEERPIGGEAEPLIGIPLFSIAAEASPRSRGDDTNFFEQLKDHERKTIWTHT